MDGHPSVNLVAMYSLDGQGGDRNVFSNTWTHFVAKPRSVPLKVVGAAFHLSLPLICGQPAGRCVLACAPWLPPAWHVLLLPRQHWHGAFPACILT